MNAYYIVTAGMAGAAILMSGVLSGARRAIAREVQVHQLKLPAVVYELIEAKLGYIELAGTILYIMALLTFIFLVYSGVRYGFYCYPTT